MNGNGTLHYQHFSLMLLILTLSSNKTFLSECQILPPVLATFDSEESFKFRLWYINGIVVHNLWDRPSLHSNLSFSIIIIVLEIIPLSERKVLLFSRFCYCHSNVSYLVAQSSFVYFFFQKVNPNVSLLFIIRPILVISRFNKFVFQLWSEHYSLAQGFRHEWAMICP